MQFAFDVACGGLNQAQLAERHGLSPSQVSKLIRGQSRPRIAEMIAEFAADNMRLLKIRLAGLQGKALDTLRAAMEERAEPAAVGAAKYILDRGATLTFEAQQRTECQIAEQRSLMDLSPETKRLVLKELGGPAM